MSPALRPFALARYSTRIRQPYQNLRYFQRSSIVRAQERSDPAAHRNFWKTHGRALFKALTLAFFSFQVFYWAWITLETEQMKDQKSYEIKALEGEVRLLEEGRRSHRPAELAQNESAPDGKRILEEVKKS